MLCLRSAVKVVNKYQKKSLVNPSKVALVVQKTWVNSLKLLILHFLVSYKERAAII